MIETDLVVRYAETDKMGIVHHSNYFIWFEVGRTELIKKAGISYSEIENNLGVYLPLISCGCDFKKPCFYEDRLKIRTKIYNLTRSRIKFYYEVLKEGIVCATGYTEHAFVDRSFKPINLEKKNKELFGLFQKLFEEDISK
ncbi:acyl-CoA thioesterase [Caldicellulosiruptor naganoensis]|uniref:Acyl-CoA thioesterase n=1 Tax=Caldicellulosiruptor naganoensis TaxID=29324 RepID=A0ABY7BCY3_9FIRM|nr:thioesterase family protein [Caldicellulosiruptor naganoensis]WAM30694.1 acyl-CoA thioesterase [Caldicellulosiruptor naganoensis]